MKLHRNVSILLALAMTLTLAACGGGGNTVDTGSADTASTTDPITSNEPRLDLPDDLDYTGHTVTYLALDKYTSHFRLITADDTKGDVLEEAGYKRALAVSELLGVEFDKYETMDVPSTLSTAVMAGEETFDFVLPHCQSGPAALVTGGLLQPWDDIEYVNFENPWWNKTMQDTISIAGKTYFASGDITMTWQGMGAVLFNKDYLDKYKIEEDLYQLVYDGKWTLDKMIELAADKGDDINGDQKMDEHDQYGILLNQPAESIQLSAGQPFTKADDDGCPVLAMGGEKMVTLVEKYYKLMTSPDTFNTPYGSTSYATSIFRDIFLAGRSFLTIIDVGGLYTQLREVEHEFGLLPMPKYDEAQEGYYSGCAAGIIGIPVNADPERTGAIAEALAYYSYEYVRPAFFDEVLQHKSLRDEDSYNMLTMMHEGKVFDFAYNFLPKAAGIMNSVVVQNNSTNFASFYASIEDSYNKEMRTIYEAVIDD